MTEQENIKICPLNSIECHPEKCGWGVQTTRYGGKIICAMARISEELANISSEIYGIGKD